MTLLEEKKKKFIDCNASNRTLTWSKKRGKPNAYASFIYGDGVPKIDIVVAESAAPAHINYQFRSKSNKSFYPYSTRADRIEPIFELTESRTSSIPTLRLVNPDKWALIYDMDNDVFIMLLSSVLYAHGITEIRSGSQYDSSIVTTINDTLDFIKEGVNENADSTCIK